MTHCTRVTRALDLNPSEQAMPPRPTAVPMQPNIPQSRCCWCVLKGNHHNTVQSYTASDLCEDNSNSKEFSVCRPVLVEGSACSLVKVHAQGGRLQCAPNPLHYVEDGVRKTITPPDDYELTCRGRVLLRAAQARTGALIENSDPSAPPDDIYCTCERDLDAPGNCRLVRYARGLPNVLGSQARKSGQSACTRDVCYSLFDERTYRPRCPRYVDGEP